MKIAVECNIVVEIVGLTEITAAYHSDIVGEYRSKRAYGRLRSFVAGSKFDGGMNG